MPNFRSLLSTSSELFVTRSKPMLFSYNPKHEVLDTGLVNTNLIISRKFEGFGELKLDMTLNQKLGIDTVSIDCEWIGFEERKRIVKALLTNKDDNDPKLREVLEYINQRILSSLWSEACDGRALLRHAV